MLDDFIRRFVGLIILVALLEFFVALVAQAVAQLFHGLLNSLGWAAHALLLLGLIALSAGVAVRAARALSQAWRRGVGDERRRVSVRRRAETEERAHPGPPPQDEADPTLFDEVEE